MSFTLPDFNITCNIYTGPWSTKALRLAAVACNLAWSRRVGAGQEYIDPQLSGSFVTGSMSLLLPAGTDLRAFPTYPISDVVEVPAGTGRWYLVGFVDDIGRGFANEHRCGLIAQMNPQVNFGLYAGSQWPTPMP